MDGLTEPDPLELAIWVAHVLEHLGVRYILGGSLASTALGEPTYLTQIEGEKSPTGAPRFVRSRFSINSGRT